MESAESQIKEEAGDIQQVCFSKALSKLVAFCNADMWVGDTAIL